MIIRCDGCEMLVPKTLCVPALLDDETLAFYCSEECEAEHRRSIVPEFRTEMGAEGVGGLALDPPARR